MKLVEILNEGLTDRYLVLVDAPYPDNRVSTSSEEPVKSRVQLQSINSITVVFLHFISDHIRHLRHTENAGFFNEENGFII